MKTIADLSNYVLQENPEIIYVTMEELSDLLSDPDILLLPFDFHQHPPLSQFMGRPILIKLPKE